MDITKAEIRLGGRACKVLVENIKEFLSVDHLDDEAHRQALLRIDAISLMLEDIVRQVGEPHELTDMEVNARYKNPYYQPMSILPKEGASPKASGIK